jgi:hypothetical protein
VSRTNFLVAQFFGAIVLTATKSKRAESSAANAAVVFAWMLVFLSALSAYIATRPLKDSAGYPVDDMTDQGSSIYSEDV